MYPQITAFFTELFYLLFPPLCVGCKCLLLQKESCVCTKCENELPLLYYSKNKDNPIEELFWGKVKVEHASAHFLFVKGGVSQHMLHALKYQSRPDVGVFLGRNFAIKLKASNFFGELDLLVPVPLHPSRRRVRGYNQSEEIVRGMAVVLNLPFDFQNLYRAKANATQTHKSKSERYENVQSLFKIRNPNLFANKHILLIDDVVTTGATLEACVNAISECSNTSVSIATLAKA